LGEFKELMQERLIRGFGIEYRDRFGDYGIVGFASVEQASEFTLRDFVLSCRVAQQQVEHSFLRWLAEMLRDAGVDQLRAAMVKTARNGAIRKVFSDLSFDVVEESNESCDLSLHLTRGIKGQGRSIARIKSKIELQRALHADDELCRRRN
jgi:predicted enzyme involved in methoxymalonyl-ACP biosynthesis